MLDHKTMLIISFAAVLLLILTTLSWALRIGKWRAMAAALCRLVWLAPIITLMFPMVITEKISSNPSVRTLQILMDDSDSMGTTTNALSHRSKAESLVHRLEQKCSMLDCRIHLRKLTEFADGNSSKITPLSDALQSWQMELRDDPWIVLTDGGDQSSATDWADSLKGIGQSASDQQKARGAIRGYYDHSIHNIWIDQALGPPLAFHESPVVITVGLERNEGQSSKPERVQIQIEEAGHGALASQNVNFAEGETRLSVDISVPPLERGQHLLRVHVLPTKEEKYIWDNERFLPVEILTNTVGMLHLLGSPSWDGRFMRRFLKSEPKFDLISFFILRDIWDTQDVSERELSLIPFPVKRLFEDELPNFRVVVMQNFNLSQFLESNFQQNLVNYVQSGGGLLFLGGPRSLSPNDLQRSPFSQLVPFKAQPLLSRFRSTLMPGETEDGLAFDPNMSFQAEIASPSPEQKALASIFEDWNVLRGHLAAMQTFRGLHMIPGNLFDPAISTPLLEARLADGRKFPLAVASYPGKGRAIWIFSDAFWQLAMAPGEKIARQVYDQFLQSALGWLMHDEIKKPIYIKNIKFQRPKSSSDQLKWDLVLRGPAMRYFDQGASWKLHVCDQELRNNEIFVQRLSDEEQKLSGDLDGFSEKTGICDARLEIQHKAFGLLNAGSSQVIPRNLDDQQMGGSLIKLRTLARITGAKLLGERDDATLDSELESWVDGQFREWKLSEPAQFRSIVDGYWIFAKPIFWLLIIFLPLEILIRRWHLIVG